MTKAEIADAVYELFTDMTKKQACEAVDEVFKSIKATLTEGRDVKISGFGKFVVREKKSRIGRNPQTGEPMTIDARQVVTFKLSNVLRDAVNGD